MFRSKPNPNPARTAWGNFPDVLIHAPPGTASRHPDYPLAKGQGNVIAALRLVRNLLNDSVVERIRSLIDGRSAVLIPVYAEEAISINRLPLVFAETLATPLGLTVSTTIVQSAKVGRTQGDGWLRIALPPPFDGLAPTEFEFAILLDDTLTQGGTIANLRGHLEVQGIKVIAATTLTGKQYSAKLATQLATLNEVKNRYASLESWWIEVFGYGFDCLTESEARYLAKSGQDADAIRDRILAARHAANLYSS